MNTQRPGQRVQLHRALSKLGWGSRKQAWAWIQAGEVCVDGRVERQPLAWVDLERQRVTRLGREAPAAPVTLALHKPRGIVTTRCDERGRRTVYGLLPEGLPWVFPAGRLDADSEGLIILTNDSRLAVRLTDPEQHIPKVYEIALRGRPAPAALERIRQGLTLRDGPTRPTQVEILEERPEETRIAMVLTEGRNRQARRMWAAVGHRVHRLKRVAIGGYQLGSLAIGGVRQLNVAETQALLQRTVRLSRKPG
jgi:23S rRNA pseudouridine2605 synthase